MLENILTRETSFLFSSSVGLLPTCLIYFCPQIYTIRPKIIAIPAKPKPACHPHFATTTPIIEVANNEPKFMPM